MDLADKIGIVTLVDDRVRIGGASNGGGAQVMSVLAGMAGGRQLHHPRD